MNYRNGFFYGEIREKNVPNCIKDKPKYRKHQSFNLIKNFPNFAFSRYPPVDVFK